MPEWKLFSFFLSRRSVFSFAKMGKRRVPRFRRDPSPERPGRQKKSKRNVELSRLLSPLFLQPEEKNLWDHLSWAANYALLNELSGVCTQRPSSVPSNNRSLPSAMPNAKLLGFTHRTAKDAKLNQWKRGKSTRDYYPGKM